MKFGIRTPSLKRRISARLSVKRAVRHRLGLKMPRGLGFTTNPKRFFYNKVYNKTSVSVDRLIPKMKRISNSNGVSFTAVLILLAIILLFIAWPIGLIIIIYLSVKPFLNRRNKVDDRTDENNGQEERNTPL